MFQFPAFASYPYVFESKIPYHNAWKPRPFVKTDWIFQAFKVGCPIRRSMDQSSFAAPHGLSQRITSFIACACQGIHQLPLRHLIVLIANAHPVKDGIGTKRPASRDRFEGAVRLTHHERKIERLSRQTRAIVTPSAVRSKPGGDRAPAKEFEQIFSLRCHTEQAESRACRKLVSKRVTLPSSRHLALSTGEWWSQTGSNRRPHACKARALPAELWPLIPSVEEKWWAWEDLNLRPHAYQARALTN